MEDMAEALSPLLHTVTKLPLSERLRTVGVRSGLGTPVGVGLGVIVGEGIGVGVIVGVGVGVRVGIGLIVTVGEGVGVGVLVGVGLVVTVGVGVGVRVGVGATVAVGEGVGLDDGVGTGVGMLDGKTKVTFRKLFAGLASFTEVYWLYICRLRLADKLVAVAYCDNHQDAGWEKTMQLPGDGTVIWRDHEERNEFLESLALQ